MWEAALMLQMPSKAFHSILYLLLETKGLKREGDWRRKLWVDFMRLKRAKWEPTSVLMQVFHFLMQVCLYTTTMCDKPLSARAKQMVSTTLQQVVS